METLDDPTLAALYEGAKRGKWRHLVGLFDELPRLAARAARYQKPSSGWTFLHQAAHFGLEPAARALIRAGADLERKTRAGESAIDVAKARGHAELALLLRAAWETGHKLWRPVADPAVRPGSAAWKQATKRIAATELRAGYAGKAVRIPKGATYYEDDFGRILVGWHGSYSPPRDMGAWSLFPAERE